MTQGSDVNIVTVQTMFQLLVDSKRGNDRLVVCRYSCAIRLEDEKRLTL